ncbi:MAG: thioredoxin family protein [Verrucomicrobia bacterium]|nr:thioredoxin family protein [Verrucomicrobiota bacterium]
MKTLLTTLALTLLACTGLRAEEGWLTDFDKAIAQAKKENKIVLADFNGSDWCPPCKALRKDVFSDQTFIAFAKDNLVLLDVDFPRGKKQSEELQKHNEKLQDKFNVDGFPTVVILNAEGKVLAKEVGYDGETANDYIKKLKKLKAK